MRIVFMSQVLPLPLDAGPKVRSYHVIRYLAEAGHEVHLLSFVRKGDSADDVAALRRMCASVETVDITRSRLRDIRDGVKSVLTPTPFLVLRDQVEPMWQTLRSVVGRRSVDALHADQLWMAPYGMNGINPGLRVLDQHNAVFMIPRRLAEVQKNAITRSLLRSEAAKLEAFEKNACDRFDRVVWVTEEDRQALVGDRGARDTVIPIATDPAANPRIPRPRPFRITFLGGMHWPPNMEGVSWFVNEVWPRVSRNLPSAILTLVGKQPARRGPSWNDVQRVEVTGYVADPSRYLAETAAFIVPLRSGAGMRVKILDAWCWGLPVVSTTIGAEGLKAVDGENLLLADDAEAFAEAVIGMVRNPRMAQRLAGGGRATVETHYDWRRVYTAWDRVYSS